MLRDRPAPHGPLVQSAQLGLQESRPPGNGWEVRPGLGPTSPKARRAQTQAVAEVPTLWLLHQNGPSPVSPSRSGWGEVSAACQDPASGPGQLHRRPPLTSLCHLDSCLWPQPSLALPQGKKFQINHCRPCLSQAETGPSRSAGIHPLHVQGLERTYLVTKKDHFIILMSVPFLLMRTECMWSYIICLCWWWCQ